MTHDQEEALAIADRIAVMREGRIEQIGTPEDIYGAPRSDFVADFIGISNLLSCRVVLTAEGLVEWEGERFRAPLASHADGAEVVISLRPECLRVVPDGAALPGLNRFDGVLEVVTFLGPVARLEVTVHGRPFWVDVPPAQARAYQRKKPLALAFDGEDCVVTRRREGDDDPGWRGKPRRRSRGDESMSETRRLETVADHAGGASIRRQVPSPRPSTLHHVRARSRRRASARAPVRPQQQSHAQRSGECLPARRRRAAAFARVRRRRPSSWPPSPGDHVIAPADTYYGTSVPREQLGPSLEYTWST